MCVGRPPNCEVYSWARAGGRLLAALPWREPVAPAHVRQLHAGPQYSAPPVYAADQGNSNNDNSNIFSVTILYNL